jgi:hypothetical protein
MQTGTPLTTNITSARLPFGRPAGLSVHSQVTWNEFALVFSKSIDLHRAMALFLLVVPLPLAAQPGEHVAVALNGRRDRVKRLDDRADRVRRHPGVECRELRGQIVAEEHRGATATLLLGELGGERRPTDLDGVLHHRELHGARLADLERAHADTCC